MLEVVIEAAKSACNNHFATIASIGIDDFYMRSRNTHSTSAQALPSDFGKTTIKQEPDQRGVGHRSTWQI
jgi:hypothetical protein